MKKSKTPQNRRKITLKELKKIKGGLMLGGEGETEYSSWTEDAKGKRTTSSKCGITDEANLALKSNLSVNRVSANMRVSANIKKGTLS